MCSYIIIFSERHLIQTSSVKTLNSDIPGDLGAYMTEIHVKKSNSIMNFRHLPCHVMLDVFAVKLRVRL